MGGDWTRCLDESTISLYGKPHAPEPTPKPKFAVASMALPFFAISTAALQRELNFRHRHGVSNMIGAIFKNQNSTDASAALQVLTKPTAAPRREPRVGRAGCSQRPWRGSSRRPWERFGIEIGGLLGCGALRRPSGGLPAAPEGDVWVILGCCHREGRPVWHSHQRPVRDSRCRGRLGGGLCRPFHGRRV